PAPGQAIPQQAQPTPSLVGVILRAPFARRTSLAFFLVVPERSHPPALPAASSMAATGFGSAEACFRLSSMQPIHTTSPFFLAQTSALERASCIASTSAPS